VTKILGHILSLLISTWPLLTMMAVVGLILYYAGWRALRRLGNTLAENIGLVAEGVNCIPGLVSAREKKYAIGKLGPKSFYYLDERIVIDLYPQITDSPDPHRIETRQSDSTSAEVGLDAKIIAPRYARGKAAETTLTYDVRMTPSMMYAKIEASFFDTNRVTFGIEDFDYDRTAVDEFTSMCSKMDDEFSFQVPPDLQKRYKEQKIREQAMWRLQWIGRANGYVALLAEFHISEESASSYSLTLDHPMNRYLGEGDPRVTISISCPRANLTPSGTTVFAGNAVAKLTVVGKVIRWADDSRTLIVNPITVY